MVIAFKRDGLITRDGVRVGMIERCHGSTGWRIRFYPEAGLSVSAKYSLTMKGGKEVARSYLSGAHHDH